MRSGEARSMPKYYKIFDAVLGTRNYVELGEVREAGCVSEEAIEDREQHVWGKCTIRLASSCSTAAEKK